jgi:hypothetical protein
MLADDELLKGFDTGSLPDDAFHHQEHVRVAWIYVRQHGLPDALGTFSTALRRFAAAKGKPQLYHTTITWAFLLLIGERLRRGLATSWAEFVQENPDLLSWKPSVLDRYYSPDRLWSALARETFVFPDRYALS